MSNDQNTPQDKRKVEARVPRGFADRGGAELAATGQNAGGDSLRL